MASKVTFKLDSHFDSYSRKVAEAVRASVDDSLTHGARVARQHAPHSTGALEHGIEVVRANRTARGYAGSISGRAFYTIFQELGTRGRRTRKLKGTTSAEHKARRAALGGKGIKGKRFLLRGLREARQSWPGHMRSRL